MKNVFNETKTNLPNTTLKEDGMTVINIIKNSMKISGVNMINDKD